MDAQLPVPADPCRSSDEEVMPHYMQTPFTDDDWFFESSVVYSNLPLQSVNRQATIDSAFWLGKNLIELASEPFAWVSFCKYTPNSEYGVQVHSDYTFQVFFTRFGLSLTKDWETQLIPSTASKTEPVLIYDYDVDCFKFCDKTHFWPEPVIRELVPRMFDVNEDLPSREDGLWCDVYEYMSEFDMSENEHGSPTRPIFVNSIADEPSDAPKDRAARFDNGNSTAGPR